MNQLSAPLTRRLLFILHRGLVEMRNLALAQGNKQIAELADALEILPSLIDHWQDEHLQLIHFVLEKYQKEFPESTYDYLGYLEKYETPDRF
jgi:hypothetical protein